MKFDTVDSTWLRNDLTVCLERGDLPGARLAARILLQGRQATPRNLSFVNNVLSSHADVLGSLKPVKVALLASFTIDLVRNMLTAEAFCEGVAPEFYQSGFDLYRQEIVDPNSGLYGFAPDVVILAVEGERWLPELYRDYLLDPERDWAVSVDAALDDVGSLLRQLRSRSNASVLLHNLFPPRWPTTGILDGSAATGQRAMVNRFNDGLSALCRDLGNAFIVDYNALISRVGAENWFDIRMAHYARAPISQTQMPRLAREYLKFLRARSGMTRKCLVVDLDNTLWGGVLGEAGPLGISLGAEFPGSAFTAFQRGLRDLYHRGVILAIASKNNRADVDEAFALNRNMVLDIDHFAAKEIGWEPKSKSLLNISKSLNIGLEHMVFVDDNPVECVEVRQALPEVTVINLPHKTPEKYLELLLDDGLFDTLSSSAEDRSRARFYRQRDKVEEARRESNSLESFYRKLEMRMRVLPVCAENLARAAQLTQKTNQFNLTTRRYSESEVAARSDNSDWVMFLAQLEDCFGDNGIVGVVMAKRRGDALDVDTFLLSCRVIGRTVETAMLHALGLLAKQAGASRLTGDVIFTPKNLPARDLYQRHGFTQLEERPDEGTSWTLHIGQQGVVPCPEWIQLHLEQTFTHIN